MVAVKRMRNIFYKSLGVFLGAFLLISHTVSAVNYGAGLYNANLYSAATPDTTAPVLSLGSPTGVLANTTTSTELSVTTDESATCRYSTTASTVYGAMTNTFSTTGNTTHTTTISGLQQSTSYNYYIRCSDTSSNTTTSDYIISFSIAAQSSIVSSGSIPIAYMLNTNAIPPTDCLPTYKFSPSTGTRCPSINTTSATPSGSSSSPVSLFTRDLKLNILGPDVLALQVYLNTHGFPVALTGPGSKGFETNKFGSLTKKALIKFQIANKISPAIGYFGPKTRGVLNTVN